VFTSSALTIPAGGAAGAGAINVNSPGILDVSGVAGGLTLLSGQTLTNSGTVNGAVNIPTGATVAGNNGTFANALTLQGGSIATGGTGAIGTLNGSSLATSSSGTFLVDVGSASVDLLNLTGNATLAGSSVTLNVLATPTAGDYPILTTGTGFTGTPGLTNGTIGRNTFTLVPTGN